MANDAMTLDEIRKVIQNLEKEAFRDMEASHEPRLGRESNNISAFNQALG